MPMCSSTSEGCTGIVLRRLLPADAGLVSALEKRAFPTFWTEEQYARKLGLGLEGLGGTVGFGAFAGSEEECLLVGYVALGCAAGECEVENIAVDKAFRGRGIATVLLRHALQEVRKMHTMVCYLEVAVGNAPARALYAGAGFRQTGLRRKYYRETGEDALVMMLEFQHWNS